MAVSHQWNLNSWLKSHYDMSHIPLTRLDIPHKGLDISLTRLDIPEKRLYIPPKRLIIPRNRLVWVDHDSRTDLNVVRILSYKIDLKFNNSLRPFIRSFRNTIWRLWSITESPNVQNIMQILLTVVCVDHTNSSSERQKNGHWNGLTQENRKRSASIISPCDCRPKIWGQ